ncbi:uracil phosphoribosyltransferase [Mycoplasmoides fastidiosum]|uniref:Uracil phosphoribosyltransferase n=1 Tax=Mycoplasmoides fastidiosum TaxID=92758 RepID=A0ABU0LYC8_9BACT|nr:uracil phosphoribosyltransferase [Mycoplasmoides fastidiosum]MDQ0513727.1 uracil phosphoribosyltransferase [Mycoplasmoides fastidiosum]UUD37851.1 uracil phosphoribosyltransferase [Mycoplasmoides fastidiosum]
MHLIIDHPLIKDKLSRMRDEETSSVIFRNNLYEITQLIAYEATKNFLISPKEIQTPVAKTIGYRLKNEVVIVPILRAGLTMSDALLNLMPNSSIGHIGLYRDEKNLVPIKYYEKIPTNVKNSDVIICDPMIATANSIISAIEIIKTYQPLTISVIGLVAAPEGLTKLKQVHPDVKVFCAALDEKLNDKGYIVPGLGDAGDRLFKTK